MDPSTVRKEEEPAPAAPESREVKHEPVEEETEDMDFDMEWD